MLNRLHIEHFAIIEVMDITFNEGLTIITGDTGCGKSLIINAINLLKGDKGNPSMIRRGFNKAIIEGEFINNDKEVIDLLTSFNITILSSIIIRRELLSSGKSTYKINGIVVSTKEITKISEVLFDVSIQNESLKLLNKQNYFSFIDTLEIKDLLITYQLVKSQYEKSLLKYNCLVHSHEESIKNIDFLKFQLEELSSASLISDEDKVLEIELLSLKNYDTIYQKLKSISNRISDNNITESLFLIHDDIDDLSIYQSEYKDYLNGLNDAYYSLTEISKSVNDSLNNLIYDEARIDEINNRLSFIRRLEIKYHKSLNELVSYLLTLEKEVNNIECFDLLLQEANDEVIKLFNRLKELSNLISIKRRVSIANISDSIVKTLNELCLPSVVVKIENKVTDLIDPFDSSVFTHNGVDQLEFFISFNKGESLKPLSKVASGGETSRVLLALKYHLYLNNTISFIAFDEIDTGLSGEAAEGCAKLLKKMSESRQVISVTHIPLVASYATNHLYISKYSNNDLTYSTYHYLNKEEVKDVLLKMIDPNNGKSSMLQKKLSM